MATIPRHILPTLEESIQSLRNGVLTMASQSERSLLTATKGLFERDDERCGVAIADDEEIDFMEIQIDRDGVEILTRFQPLARDLRQVITAMKCSVNIERIGDQAVNIARRARKLSREPELAAVQALQPIFALATTMFRDATRAYSDSNLELAKSLKTRDKNLDNLNREFADHCTHLMASDPKNLPSYLNLIFIARFLERVGDHASNIGEDVVYAISAEEIRHTQTNAID